VGRGRKGGEEVGRGSGRERIVEGGEGRWGEGVERSDREVVVRESK